MAKLPAIPHYVEVNGSWVILMANQAPLKSLPAIYLDLPYKIIKRNGLIDWKMAIVVDDEFVFVFHFNGCFEY